jgi:peptidoglycan biosynthesis protein MviN/MurJ (putative lipid II flippase)
MAAGVHVLTPDTARWLDAALAQRIAWLAGLIAAGAGVYALVLTAAGLRPRQFVRPAGARTDAG